MFLCGGCDIVPVNTRVCKNCGESVSPPEEIFCAQCGTRILEKEEPVEQPKQPSIEDFF